MKTLFILTSLLFNNILFGQYLQAEYVASMSQDKADIKRLGKLNSFPSHYMLTISNEESSMDYFVDDKIREERLKRKNGSVSQPFGTTTRYNNIKDSTSIFTVDNYLVTDTLRNWKWEITSKTKTILGYKVVKAISREENATTIAWFVPDIKTALGPAALWGLPGLILEFKSTFDNNNDPFNIICKIVDLKILQEKPLIEKPTEGDPITEKELYKKYNN